MALSVNTPEWFMKEALKQAALAYEKNEVPVGAIVVAGNRVISRAHNQVEMLNDPTAHAEILAITSATAFIGSKYLEGCTMYVTLEPCSMCAGALNWALLDKLYYGASDDKRGYTLISKRILHPRTEVFSGILAEESSELLRHFFRTLRAD